MLIDFQGPLSIQVDSHPGQFAVRFNTDESLPGTGFFLEHSSTGSDTRVCRSERQVPLECEELFGTVLETHVIPLAEDYGGTHYRLTTRDHKVYMKVTETVEIVSRRHESCVSISLHFAGAGRAIEFSQALPETP